MLKFVALLLLSISFTSSHAQAWSEDEISALLNHSIESIQSSNDISNSFMNDKKAISLGKALFVDKRLSSNKSVSCSSCHIEEHAFTDNKKLAFGLRQGFRNTSTLLNVSTQDWFFADGAKDSLWAQALSSIENPAEQNFTRMEMLHLIATDENYRKQYQQIFKDELPERKLLRSLPKKAGPNAQLKDLIAWKKLNKQQRESTNIVFTNIGKSIAAYVSTIKSKPSRFDDFVSELKDSKSSQKLNASEQRGLRLFMSKESGCSNCHSGPQFSNKTFHDISTGIPGKDNGRSEVIESVVRDEFNCLSKYSDAKPEECVELNYVNRDKHRLAGAYKTATLRGIGKTAPYMHDGRFETLNEVIDHYVLVSQNKNNDLTIISLNKEQRSDLLSFLLTL